MKVVILAGGRGSRMEKETIYIPKPMIEIGNRPMLWHIMKYYSCYGFNEFIICLGYKGEVIRDYFLNYDRMNHDCTVSLLHNDVEFHEQNKESQWRVTLVNTGLETQTGGRLKRIQPYVKGESFMLTYGDGLSDIDIGALLKTHRHCHQITNSLGTLTAVLSKSRFGEIEFEGNYISTFEEKSKSSWINGGFFVFEPEVFDLIEGDNEPLEAGLLHKLTMKHKLAVFRHDGFWGCMDNVKETEALKEIWNTGNAPWKLWT